MFGYLQKYVVNKKFILSAFYVFLFLFLLKNSFNYLDNDFGWHLQVGRYIYEYKQVPHIEGYDYTLAGVRWVDHEWLINLVVFLIDDYFGYVLLTVFFALLFILTLFLFNNLIIKYFLPSSRTGDFLILITLEFLGIFGVIEHLGIRVQEVTLLGLVLLLSVIFSFEFKKNVKSLIWLPILMFLWANLHGGFLIGFAIMFFWIFIKILENILSKYPTFSFLDFTYKKRYKEIILFFITAVTAFLTTFFTPYGPELYFFLGDYFNTFYTKIILEWLPIYYYPFDSLKFLYLALIIAFLSVIFVNSLKNKTNQQYRISLWEYAIILVFSVLSFRVRRHFPLLFFVSLPTISVFLSKEVGLSLERLFDFKKNRKLAGYLVVVGALAYVSSLTIIFLNTNFTNHPFENKAYCTNFPCEAINFLKENPQYGNKKMFSEYDWGGFMIWVWPKKKLFIDGRLPQFKYKEYTILEEYKDFFNKNKIEEKLKQHDIEMVLIRRSKTMKFSWLERHFLRYKELENQFFLADFFSKNKEWKEVYSDKLSKIFVKNGL